MSDSNGGKEKKTNVKKQMFSVQEGSDRVGCAELAKQLSCWERPFYLPPSEEVDNFRKGLDSVLIGPFRH